jgi:heme ABC exporter ATP-binding subunit CcmA
MWNKVMKIDAVEIKNINKSFDGHYVLREVSLKLTGGKILTLVGPNGAGKTTLANITAGITQATSGRIFINGQDLSSNRKPFQTRMGIVIHESLLYEDLTVYENLKFYSRLYGVSDSENTINEILKTIGLEHKTNQRARNLSRGMHQRLSIGRGMIPDPDFYIFDEPFTNLDLESTNTVVGILKRLRDDGKLVFLTTHNLEVASQISNEIAILHYGKICKRVAGPVSLEELERTYIDLTGEVEPGIII